MAEQTPMENGVPATQVGRRIADLLTAVERGERIPITRKGEPVAMLVPYAPPARPARPTPTGPYNDAEVQRILSTAFGKKRGKD